MTFRTAIFAGIGILLMAFCIAVFSNAELGLLVFLILIGLVGLTLRLIRRVFGDPDSVLELERRSLYSSPRTKSDNFRKP